MVFLQGAEAVSPPSLTVMEIKDELSSALAFCFEVKTRIN